MMVNSGKSLGNRLETGLVMVLTGDGKGKTTSALGMLLRSWGHDMKAAVLQFIKKPDEKRGESIALHRLGVELISGGSGFTWQGNNKQTNQVMTEGLWEKAREMIKSGQYDLIILDEFTYPIKFGWIGMEEVRTTLEKRPSNLHVIITGRDAPEALVEFSDSAMEIKSIKHHLQKGIRSQPGIEY
jgi:cob(I)alamin adenosyltransferase